MPNNYSHLPLGSLLPQFNLWENLLLHRQACHLYFLPHTGMLYRIYQYRDYYNSHNKTLVKVLDMNTDLLSEPQSLLDALTKNGDSQIILLAHKHFSGPDRANLAQALQTASLTQKTGLLVAHESAPSEVLNTSLPSIMHHQINVFTPISDKQSIHSYITNLASDWGVTLLPKDIETFTAYCHNQLWLINDLLRLRLDNPLTSATTLLNSPSLTQKTQIIWDDLPQPYQNYYLQISELTPTIENEIEKVGLPLLNQTINQPYLHKLISNIKSNLLQISPSRLIYLNNDFTSDFSKSERSILSLLHQKRQILDRESIAHIYWPSNYEEAYSDWALDKLMSRLRKKLAKYQLPIYIQTRRGKGYACNRN